jgi:hypothetical protein
MEMIFKYFLLLTFEHRLSFLPYTHKYLRRMRTTGFQVLTQGTLSPRILLPMTLVPLSVLGTNNAIPARLKKLSSPLEKWRKSNKSAISDRVLQRTDSVRYFWGLQSMVYTFKLP